MLSGHEMILADPFLQDFPQDRWISTPRCLLRQRHHLRTVLSAAQSYLDDRCVHR
jgi:hypothetical protein